MKLRHHTRSEEKQREKRFQMTATGAASRPRPWPTLGPLLGSEQNRLRRASLPPQVPGRAAAAAAHGSRARPAAERRCGYDSTYGTARERKEPSVGAGGQRSTCTSPEGSAQPEPDPSVLRSW